MMSRNAVGAQNIYTINIFIIITNTGIIIFIIIMIINLVRGPGGPHIRNYTNKWISCLTAQLNITPIMIPLLTVMSFPLPDKQKFNFILSDCEREAIIILIPDIQCFRSLQQENNTYILS